MHERGREDAGRGGGPPTPGSAMGGEPGAGSGGDSTREGSGPGRIINYRTDPYALPAFTSLLANNRLLPVHQYSIRIGICVILIQKRLGHGLAAISAHRYMRGQ